MNEEKIIITPLDLRVTEESELCTCQHPGTIQVALGVSFIVIISLSSHPPIHPIRFHPDKDLLKNV